MSSGFRRGFHGALSVALLTGVALLWLWQPERQVRKHTESLFHAMEGKNWERLEGLVASDYMDQWGHDRSRMLERVREVFGYVRNVRITSSAGTVQVDQRTARWTGKIVIETDQNEMATLVRERINSLTTPFEMEWRRLSAKPWDWKLVRVSNEGFEIPAEAY